MMKEKNSDSSDSLSISKKPAFRISAPEYFFDLDDDEDGNTNDLSIPSTSSPFDSITEISVRNDSSSKTSAEKLQLSSSMLSFKFDFIFQDNGFAFHIASDPSAEKPSAVTFGVNNYNSTQNSSILAAGASDSNSQKPDAINFGGENHNSKFTGFGATDIGVFSSSPSFGLSNSASGGFGNSAFGSASSSPNPFTPGSGVAFFSSLNSLSSTSIFGSRSPASSASPVFSCSSASVFGSSASGSAAPVKFGPSSSSASGSATPPFASFAFNSSSSNTGVWTPAPVLGMQNPAFGFGGTNSAENDQMIVEDSRTDASNQAPSFPAGSLQGLTFGSPAPPQNGGPSFLFGRAQYASAPFQASGNVDFNLDGSFYLGSGTGGDKSARNIIKARQRIRGRR